MNMTAYVLICGDTKYVPVCFSSCRQQILQRAALATSPFISLDQSLKGHLGGGC